MTNSTVDALRSDAAKRAWNKIYSDKISKGWKPKKPSAQYTNYITNKTTIISMSAIAKMTMDNDKLVILYK